MRGRKSIDTESDNGTRKPYDLRSILELKFAGLSYSAIGKYYGKDQAAIYRKLKPFRHLADGELGKAVEGNRVPLLKAVQWKLLTEAMKSDKFKKANLGNFFYGFDKLDHAIRLELGESTSNIALHAIVEAMEREGAGKRPALPGAELEDDDKDS